MVIHVNRCPYGAVRRHSVYRKIGEANVCRSKVHLAATEKVGLIVVTQEHDLAI